MEACVINIGENGQRKRRQFGQLMIVVGVAASIALIVAGVDRWWRLAVFVPFVLGGIGIFQASART